jgi:hypothetical protein
MPKFLIKLHGEHYKIEVEKKDFFFRKRSDWKNVGFYTTRFIESETAGEAIEKALELVEKELVEIADSTENSSLILEQIQEDDEAYNLYAPGSGFSFYAEDDE